MKDIPGIYILRSIYIYTSKYSIYGVVGGLAPPFSLSFFCLGALIFVCLLFLPGFASTRFDCVLFIFAAKRLCGLPKLSCTHVFCVRFSAVVSRLPQRKGAEVESVLWLDIMPQVSIS